MRVCFLYPHLFGHEGYVRDINRLHDELNLQAEHIITKCPPFKDSAISGRPGFDELRLIKPLRSALKEVDVIHIFGLFFPLYPLLAQIVRSSGKPYVLSPLGQLEIRALSISEKKKSGFMKLFGKRMLNQSAIIHTFSTSETESVEAFSPKASIMEAPLGIYYEDIPTEIKQSKLRPENEYFLFFGRLGYFHKGIDVLLNGYAQYLKNGGVTKLVVAGKSWHGSHEVIKQKIQALGIADKIHFIGEVPLDEKYSLINECKAFVYPSRFDGPPRPIREALALHKPLLVSRQSNIISNIESLGWGYEFNPEPAELALAMHQMDSAYTKDNYVDPKDKLSWEIVAKQYSAIYDNLKEVCCQNVSN